MSLDIIHRCVRACSQARDGRGRWRVADDTARRLMQAGSSHTIAAMTAQAAADLGAWIRRRGDEVARELRP